jgi:hypothetical protein
MLTSPSDIEPVNIEVCLILVYVVNRIVSECIIQLMASLASEYAKGLPGLQKG